jgi:membrane protein CcdC involved in cytochrome C biogenesis
VQIHTAQPAGLLQYAIPIVIAAAVLALRARRMTRVRPLKLGQLWIVPAIYLAIVVALFVMTPPSAIGWPICVAALLAGAAIGWQRGKTMRIEVNPENGTLNQKASMAGVAFLVILFAIKFAAQTGTHAFHVNVAVLTDAFAALALGMFTMTRVEMYLRAKRLLETARV